MSSWRSARGTNTSQATSGAVVALGLASGIGLVTGCKAPPPLVDHWTATHAICQPPDPFVSPYRAEGFDEEACHEAIAADLGLDEASFEGNAEAEATRSNLLEAAYQLLGRPLGSVEEARAYADDAHWVRTSFVDELDLMAEELGTDDVRALIYSTLATVVATTRYWSEPIDHAGAGYSFRRDELAVTVCEAPPYCSFSLVHEAAHGWLGASHVACPEGHVLEEGWDYSGVVACDEDWSTVWGLQAGVIVLAYQSVVEAEPENQTTARHIEYIGRIAEFFILED